VTIQYHHGKANVPKACMTLISDLDRMGI